MTSFGDLEGKTYGEIAVLDKTVEERLLALEAAMREIYPHAHCHPDHCPCKATDDQNGKQ